MSAVVERLIPLAQQHEVAADDVKTLKQHLVTIYRNLDLLDREIAEEGAGGGRL